MLARRNGPARGIYDCLPANRRLPEPAVFVGVRFRLDTSLNYSGISARQMVFGSNPADLVMWRYADNKLEVPQGAPPSSQAAQRWELRAMAQEVAQQEMASSKLR